VRRAARQLECRPVPAGSLVLNRALTVGVIGGLGRAEGRVGAGDGKGTAEWGERR